MIFWETGNKNIIGDRKERHQGRQEVKTLWKTRSKDLMAENNEGIIIHELPQCINSYYNRCFEHLQTQCVL